MQNRERINSIGYPGAADDPLTIGLLIANTVEAWELPQWRAHVDTEIVTNNLRLP